MFLQLRRVGPSRPGRTILALFAIPVQAPLRRPDVRLRAMSGRSNLIAVLNLAQAVSRQAGRRLAERLARHVPAGFPAPSLTLQRLVPRKGPPAILPGLDTKPAPMRPVRPPAAVNDNPLAALQIEVERDLRARGYLR